MKFLPEEVYSFFGQEIGVRSNSSEVLSHLRSIYGRFYKGCDEAPSIRQKEYSDK